MAQRAIREYDAKRIMERLWKGYFGDDVVFAGKTVQVEPCTDWDQLKRENPWLEREKLVAKPDQLVGKRGKQGLILLDADFKAVKEWILERMGKPIALGKVTGVLTSYTTGFLVSCTSLGSPIVKNQSCGMTSNINVVNGCQSISKVLMNSSGNTGTVTNNQIQAGVPVLLHQVCLTIPSNESVSIAEDPVTDLTTSVDIGNGMFTTEFPTFETATFYRIRYDDAQHTAFLDFQGTPAGERISQLDWSVLANTDISSFSIERSFDGEVYETIGAVPALQEDQRIGIYQFFDKAAQIGDNFYRLRQIDDKGQETFSPVRKIVFDAYPFAVTATPNPVKDKLSIRINHAKEAGTVALVDVSGQERVNTAFEMRQSKVEIDVDKLEAGIYTLRVRSGTDAYAEKIAVIK